MNLYMMQTSKRSELGHVLPSPQAVRSAGLGRRFRVHRLWRTPPACGRNQKNFLPILRLIALNFTSADVYVLEFYGD